MRLGVEGTEKRKTGEVAGRNGGADEKKQKGRGAQVMPRSESAAAGCGGERVGVDGQCRWTTGAKEQGRWRTQERANKRGGHS